MKNIVFEALQRAKAANEQAFVWHQQAAIEHADQMPEKVESLRAKISRILESFSTATSAELP